MTAFSSVAVASEAAVEVVSVVVAEAAVVDSGNTSLIRIL